MKKRMTCPLALRSNVKTYNVVVGLVTLRLAAQPPALHRFQLLARFSEVKIISTPFSCASDPWMI